MPEVPSELGIGYKEEQERGALYVYINCAWKNYTCYFVLYCSEASDEWVVRDWTNAVTQTHIFDHLLLAVAYMVNRKEELE